MNVGSKSITAQRQRIRDRRRERADRNKRHRELRAKAFITLNLNFKPLCDALKKLYEIYKDFSEQIKESLSKVFPIPAMLNLYLQLQLADNTRPNMYLVGWGRLE